MLRGKTRYAPIIGSQSNTVALITLSIPRRKDMTARELCEMCSDFLGDRCHSDRSPDSCISRIPVSNIDPDYALAIVELNEEFPAGQVALITAEWRDATGCVDKHCREILVGDIFEVNGERFQDIGEAYDFAGARGLNILRV
jgi:hypothetical protein